MKDDIVQFIEFGVFILIKKPKRDGLRRLQDGRKRAIDRGSKFERIVKGVPRGFVFCAVEAAHAVNA